MILKIDLDMVKMYIYVLKIAPDFQKLWPEQTDIKAQKTDLTEIITYPHTYANGKKAFQRLIG